MSKYQALIDALAGVDGQLGQPSLHSGHVIYAETEEWCSVDINVKLSANKHISGPLARFIKEAANPSTIRALLADLERAEKALAALAQQAQEPWGWAIEDKHGVAQAIRPSRKEFFGCIQATEPFTVEDVEKMGREWPGLAPHRIVKLYATPPAPQVPSPVDEQAEFEASMRAKHGWVARDFQSDSFGYFDGHTATAWLAWQARAALQSPAPQTKVQP